MTEPGDHLRREPLGGQEGEETAVRRKRADEILDAALDLEGARRAEYLDRTCLGDASLRAMVEELIELCEEPDDLAERAEASLGLAQEAIEREALGGDRLGPYRLEGEIGRGGMGVVYLARRDDGLFENQVAVKVLQRQSPQLGQRFAQERQILAALDHPGIARLLDAGKTPSGLPYLVMEHVEGETIDAYCAGRGLSIDARLRLLTEVCEAVESAHRGLVVHRDIKPSNILVTGDGRPKLLDFGIAKLTEGAADSAQHTTVHMLTLEWASPEQVRGLPTSVQSDVYQLGLLLYSLLTGRLPYALVGLSPTEQEATICDQEALAPSAKVAGLSAEERSALAEVVGLDEDRIVPRLAGDLDAIVLKALRKDARRRYESVEQLRRDLESHLDQRPVSARLPTVRYRAGRFLRRHRLGVVVTVAVVLSFVVLAAISVQRITAERDAARLQTAIAEEVNRFLNEDLLSAVRPERQGIDVSMREVLDLASERIEGRFPDQPEVEASLRSTIGRTYMGLGVYPAAITHLERAAELYGRQRGPEHAFTLATRSDLGEVYRIVGRFDEAEALFVDVLGARRRLFGDADPATLRSINQLATVYQEMGRFEDAEPLFLEALNLWSTLPDDAEASTNLKQSLSILYQKTQRLDEAERLQMEALASMRRRFGDEHSTTLNAAINLSALYLRQKRWTDAEKVIEESLEPMARVLGPEHPKTLMMRNNLGYLLREVGRFDESEAILSEVLAIKLRSLGPSHPSTAQTIESLDGLYSVTDQRDKLLTLAVDRLAATRAQHGAEHPATLRAAFDLARTRIRLEDWSEAESLLNEISDPMERVLGAEHPLTLSLRNNRGYLYRTTGRYAEAERELTDVLEIKRRVLGPAHTSTLHTAAELAELYRETGNTEALAALESQQPLQTETDQE